jgi:hypothetical protein
VRRIRLRHCGLVLTAALWSLQGYETAHHPAWLTPPLDNLADSVMVTLTVLLGGWLLIEHLARRITRPLAERERLRDSQIGSLNHFAATLSKRARFEGSPGPDTVPIPALALVEPQERREGVG